MFTCTKMHLCNKIHLLYPTMSLLPNFLASRLLKTLTVDLLRQKSIHDSFQQSVKFSLEEELTKRYYCQLRVD